MKENKSKGKTTYMLNFFKSSIYYQILLPITGAVLIIALVFSFTGPKLITRDFEVRIDSLLEQKVDTSHTYFDNKLNEMTYRLENYSADQSFLDILKNKDYKQLRDYVFNDLNKLESLVVVANNRMPYLTIGPSYPEEIIEGTISLQDNSLLGKSVTNMHFSSGQIYLCSATPFILENGDKKDEQYLVLTRQVDKTIMAEAAKISEVDLCMFHRGELIHTTLNLNNGTDKKLHQAMIKQAKKSSAENVKIESLKNTDHFYKLIVKNILGKKDIFMGASIQADEILHARSSVTYQIWVGSLLAVLVIGIFGLITSRSITGSIRDLMSSADEISAGNYQRLIKTREVNELGTLANSLNRMSQSLLNQKSELEQNIMSLSALQELGKSLTGTLDEKKIIEFTFESIIRLFEPDASSIMIWNHKDNLLEIVKSKGIDQQTINNVKLRLGEGIAGYVAQQKKPLLLNNGLDNEEIKPIQKKENITSAISVPMVFKDQVFGVINISNFNNKQIYNSNDLRLLSTLASQASVGINNAQVYAELQKLYLKTIKALGAAVDAKDPYTFGHSSQVAEYAIAIGDELGFNEEELLCVRTAGYLHDIGKIGIPDGILLKPGKLTPEEMDIIQSHPLIAAKILEPVDFPWNVVDLVCHHHEFYNGHGYPDGIAGKSIPLGARILSVADSFEAMTSDRPYRKAFPIEYALRELDDCSGTQFDPTVSKTFIKMIKSGYLKVT